MKGLECYMNEELRMVTLPWVRKTVTFVGFEWDRVQVLLCASPFLRLETFGSN